MALEAKARHEAWLLGLKGVVGVAAKRDRLVVYVEDAEACARVPKALDGVPVECRVVGRLAALRGA